jgi:hypothetical protein
MVRAPGSPSGVSVLQDAFLSAIKIALETDEQAALAVANCAPERRGLYLQSNRPNVGASSVTPVLTGQPWT